jgi:hypothetical protein
MKAHITNDEISLWILSGGYINVNFYIIFCGLYQQQKKKKKKLNCELYVIHN